MRRRVGVFLRRLLTEKGDWIRKVNVKWHPEDYDIIYLSRRPPEEIAKIVSQYHDSCKSALASSLFFYNRFGCTGKRKDYPLCKWMGDVIEEIRNLMCEEE